MTKAKKQIPLYVRGMDTWSGRGPRPSWLKKLLDGGNQLQDYLNTSHPDYKKRKALIEAQVVNPEEDEGTTAPVSKRYNRVIRKSLMDLRLPKPLPFSASQEVYVKATDRYGVVVSGPHPSLVVQGAQAYLVKFDTDDGMRQIDVDASALVDAASIPVQLPPEIEKALEALLRIVALEAKFDLFQKNNRRLPANMKPNMSGITPASFGFALNRLRRTIINCAKNL